ncbi:10640_t:CDS:2 [Dentiscutata heterogama]|uniref:10640_t:CDS:1 n=1 Tax=Dentiscutata heterogama TaxID=1316150 RepID=A0ACA9ML94_9GLOM|nr:10640_t:CDS:2 [Dentiscutata heterogama]
MLPKRSLTKDLQSEQYAYQQNHTSSVEPTYIEDQQIQNRTTSSLAAAKYQHRVPSQINIRSGVLRYNSISSNVQNTNPYTTIQQNRDYTTSAQNNEISFQDEAHLLRWLETRKDLVLQALHAICSSSPIMSNQPLKKHIDVLDYDTFKNRQLEVNLLETFIAKSLKIHVEFLKAESRGEDLDYNSIVLNRIKELDYITIGFKFSATSNLQYANQLELKEEREKSKNKRH